MKSRCIHVARRTLALVLVCTLLVGCLGVTALAAPGESTGSGGGSGLPELKLWYDEPASQGSRRGDTGSGVPTDDDDIWQKNTLPIGNGDLGANIYGEIGVERLTLNEKTLWTGGPSERRQNYIGGNLASKGQYGAQLKKVQDLFLSGKTAEGVSAAGQLVGEDNGNYGYYAPWAELNIAYDSLSTVTKTYAATSANQKNSQITWTGNWYTWNDGDGTHEGPAKVEIKDSNEGTFTYSFTVPEGKVGTLDLYADTSGGGGTITLGFTQKPSGYTQADVSVTVRGGRMQSFTELVPGSYTIQGSKSGNGKVDLDYIKLTTMPAVTNYKRWLSLDNALSGVEFTMDGVNYTREYFVSHPDNVLVAHLTASQSANITVTLPKKMNTGATTVADGNDTLKLCGELADNQEKFASFLKAVPGAGTTVRTSGDSLVVSGTEVTLYFSAATDYKAVFPTYRNGETDAELAARVLAVVDAAAVKGYADVKADHLADYYSLYNRMTLDVGQTETARTTDDLILAYKNDSAAEGEKRLLEVMLYQYGRYLTIASSREDSILPSNLQGVWNNRNNPPWMSDYHTNVNLQMNYWPTYVTNLAECADSLVRFTESLREPGRITAHIYAGIESTKENPENGFMAHTQTTPYGYTTPGWSFDWGWSPAAIAWLMENLWDYYEFTRDVDYMRNNIYPILREYTRFYDQFLIDKTSGKIASDLTAADTNVVLASVPAYSPEHGPRTAGNTYEHSIIWQLYEDTITAAGILGVDDERVGDENTPGTWRYNQSHLQGPIEIGETGELKEWYEQWGIDSSGYAIKADGTRLGSGDQGKGHRHLSHLVGLYPGDLVQTREDWIEAARVAMNNRGDVNTGWSMTHRVDCWARLRDGNHAHKVLGLMIKNDKFYNNLWDTHAPFQIDGNFGYTAGVAEMLIQSNMGFIDLLPALPDAWATGSYEGLLARGNFEVDATWRQGTLTGAAVTSKNGGECVISYPNLAQATVTDADGNLIEFTVDDSDTIRFNTAKGMKYTFSGLVEEGVTMVEDAEAFRTADDSVTVRWTGESGVKYQLYRQIGSGDILPLDELGTATTREDDTAFDELGEIRYYIQAEGCRLSSAISVQDLRDMEEIDDTDSRVKYNGGGWFSYSESGFRNNTAHIIESEVATEADAGQTVELTFLGTGIEVYGGKRNFHGVLTVEIDGVAQSEKADFYVASDHPMSEKVWSIEDLPLGVHTIKLTRSFETNPAMTTNSGGKKVNKIELDYFKVLGGQTEEPPVEGDLEISTVGGVEKLWNAGETVKFTSNLEGVTWTAVSSVTHASSCNYSEHKFSWNASTQTLTAGLTDEVVTVTATKGNKTASKKITITPKTTVTIIEDSVSHSGNTGPLNPDSRITSGGNGTWSAWWGESTKHHGGSKTENSNVGAWLQLTFTGTAVAVYGTVHFNNGAVSVLLDGEAQDDIHPCGTSGSTDLAQQKLAEYTNLANTEHTLKLTVKAANNAAGASKSNFVLDFFEVKAPNPNAPQANLEALKTAVADAATRNEAEYTPESWKTLSDLLATAGTYLNNETAATQAQVDQLVTQINAAIAALVTKPLTAPENVQVILIEGTAVTLKWDAVIGATGYKVTVDGKTYEAASTTYRVTGLKDGKAYSFTVASTNDAQVTSSPSAPVSAITRDVTAPDAPTGLSYNKTNRTLSWTTPRDNVGVTKYKVTVGTDVQEVNAPATSVVITVGSAAQTSVRVVAVDAAGNESAPATLVIAPTYTVTVTGGRVVDAEGNPISKTEFKAGEAVAVAATIPEGHIFEGWTGSGLLLGDQAEAATIHFSMPAGNVELEAITEERHWRVTTNLTDLTVEGAPEEVLHGKDLTMTLVATEPYELPATITAVMGGVTLQSPWVTYSVTTGEVTVREVTGNVTITAAGAVPEPENDTYTETDRFPLPVTVGSSTSLEAERMVLSGNATLGYGPSFGNQHIEGAAGVNAFTLYYTAEQAGRYTLTLNYSSARVADNPHTLNWSGDQVKEYNGSIPSTLENGEAVYKTTELELTVLRPGNGYILFSAPDSVGLGIDSMTFTLDAVLEWGGPVESITLTPAEKTLYLGGSAAETSIDLVAEVEPVNAEDPSIHWESSDPTVAYVTQAGKVGARSNGTVTITARAMDGSGVTATAEITVKTHVSGEVSIAGLPKFGESLVAAINQISSQDAKNSLAYQWKRDGVSIDGATDRTYTIQAGDIGHEITLTVTVTGNYFEGAAGGTTTDAVTVTKADGAPVVATLNAVDCTDGDNGQITGLNPARRYEYKLVSAGDNAWAPIPANVTALTGLPAGSYHVRVKETDTAEAGPVSGTLTILAAGATGAPVTMGDMANGVVRADVRKANEGDRVTLTVIPDEGYELAENGLKVNGVPVTVTGDTATVTMPGGDGGINVTATFVRKVYHITHDLTHVTCDSTHEVEHGESPAITLEAEAGYDLPGSIVVTFTDTGARCTDYTYVDGSIVFRAGIQGNITIAGEGTRKYVQVFYAMLGLTSLTGPRSIAWGDALTVKLEPKAGYTLPEAVTVTMGATNDEVVSTYDKAKGQVTVAAGLITGDVTISAQGVANTESSLTSVTLSGGGDPLRVGDQLRATVLPEDAFPDYQWIRVDAQGNESFISGAVNRTYVVKSADLGYRLKVAATGTSKYSGTVYSALTSEVTAPDIVAVTGITVSPGTLALTARGEAVQLQATVSPANASNKEVVWSTGDRRVAVVSQTGAVTGIAVGSTTITATTVNGGFVAECQVIVTSVSLRQTSITLTEGETAQLELDIPADLPEQKLTWVSRDPSIATVDEDGEVLAVRAGETTVTVTTSGGFTDDCKVTVKALDIPDEPVNPNPGPGTDPGGTRPSTPVETPKTETQTQTRTDGSKVTTVTEPDGKVTQTVTRIDGSKTEKVSVPGEGTTITTTNNKGVTVASVTIPATLPTTSSRFVDVPVGHWADEAIHQAAALDLVNGVGGNRYSMGTDMTRGSLTAILYRLSNVKENGVNSFDDVKDTDWYAESITWAAKNGIVTGYSPDMFAPNRSISRQELAVMLARYGALLGMDTNATTASLVVFADGGTVDSWAQSGMAWCAKQKILQGKGNGLLDPAALVSRAEVAVMLGRFVDLLK